MFCLAKKYLSLSLVTSNISMIVSFGSKDTSKIWQGERVTRIPMEIQLIGRRKLRMINNSTTLSDLRIPPSNHLEKLSGRMPGYYSIRINDQWRNIFKWEDNQALEVEIVDYH
jgi:proteic killer suppression protein